MILGLVSLLTLVRVGGIWSIFDPGEAALIGSMVLSPLQQPDKLIWRGTPSGVFSVRSAYHLEMRRLAQTSGEGLEVDRSEDMWNRLWRLQAPPILRSFFWKVCNNLLPTKTNLFSVGEWATFWEDHPYTGESVLVGAQK